VEVSERFDRQAFARDPMREEMGPLFCARLLADVEPVETIRDGLPRLPGVTGVYWRAAAAERLEVPVNRVWEWVVVSERDLGMGRASACRDLRALQSGLSSHGGGCEEMLPFMLPHPLKPA
jgi:hypothetical protein